MSRNKTKFEQKYGGEEQNSQVEYEMLSEAKKEEAREFIDVMALKRSLKHIRNQRGDRWTAQYIEEQFPTIANLINS